MRSERQWADLIVGAHAEGRLLGRPSGGDVIAPEQAYAIQSLVTQARLSRGERIVGWKLGYTSAVMREQMGIDEPNFGPLTDAMLLTSGARVPGSATQPRVEPEVALIVGEAPGTVAAARAALEVVDSVWEDYAFGWADNTADGSSAAFVVLGQALPLDGIESVEVTLRRDGEPVGEGRASAAMGSPLAALEWLRRRLGDHPRGLRPGDVVITGGLTAAVALAPGGVVSADFPGTVVSVTRATEQAGADFGSLEQ